MKILVFTETYLPTINGVVHSIELFREQLEQRGHTIDVVAPHSSTENFRARKHVLRLLSLPLIGQPSHPVAWPYMSPVQAIVEEVKPDIIHVQGMFTTGWLGKKAANRFHIPCVLTYHTHLEGYAHYAGLLSFLAKPILKWWTRHFSNHFDVVITPTPSMAKILKSYGVQTEIVALPTGINLKSYHHADKERVRKTLKFDPNTIYILTAGRLAGEKNISQLLIDFGRISVRERGVHLVLAGDGPERRAYESMVKARNLDSQVTFLGAVPHEHLIQYFIAADIFAFPSLTDTQGIVLIEAMASAMPSVVYDSLGPGDIIKHGETGFKARVGSDQFFQHLFSLVTDHELREKLSLEALREARKYSIEKTTDQLEQIYKVLLNHSQL